MLALPFPAFILVLILSHLCSKCFWPCSMHRTSLWFLFKIFFTARVKIGTVKMTIKSFYVFHFLHRFLTCPHKYMATQCKMILIIWGRVMFTPYFIWYMSYPQSFRLWSHKGKANYEKSGQEFMFQYNIKYDLTRTDNCHSDRNRKDHMYIHKEHSHLYANDKVFLNRFGGSCC